MLRDGHMPIVPLCAVDDNDMDDVEDDDDDDASVLHPCAVDDNDDDIYIMMKCLCVCHEK